MVSVKLGHLISHAVFSFMDTWTQKSDNILKNLKDHLPDKES